jgi:hypothetical protein
LYLLFHEVKSQIGARLSVSIGAPIPFEAIAHLRDRRALADHLMAATYALAREAPRALYKQSPGAKLRGKLRKLRQRLAA